jgi:formyl-CoA transferase
MDQVFNSVHLRGRGYFQIVAHPEAGEVEVPGAPYVLGHKPAATRRPAPMLGEHNGEVLCGSLGIGKEKLAGLRKNGIV